MPSIKDQSTVEAIASEFTSNGRDKTKALRTVGYSESYCTTLGVGVVYSNIRIVEAIAKIDTKKQAKYEHNQEISVEKLYTDYGYLEQQAKAGNIAAINARTAIVRELDCTTGLQKQTITTDTATPKPITASDLALLRSMARAITDRELAQPVLDVAVEAQAEPEAIDRGKDEQ